MEFVQNITLVGVLSLMQQTVVENGAFILYHNCSKKKKENKEERLVVERAKQTTDRTDTVVGEEGGSVIEDSLGTRHVSHHLNHYSILPYSLAMTSKADRGGDKGTNKKNGPCTSEYHHNIFTSPQAFQ